MDFNQFKTNKETELNGVWKNITKDARIKVARFNNPKYRVILATELRRSEEAIKLGGEIADKLVEEATLKAMSETILIDWENMNLDGVELEYSKENALLVLTQFEEFRDLVADIATSISNFKDGVKETSGK